MFTELLSTLGEFLLSHVLLTALLVALASLLLYKLTSGNARLPPGPRGLPLLGYLPFLSELLHLDFVKLHKIYGPIFSMKLGIRTAVVIREFSTIKDVLNRPEVSEKPPKMFVVTENVDHLADAKDWKGWRRFILSTLRSLGMGKNKLEGAIQEQVQSVLKRLSKANGDIDLNDILYPSTNSIIISLICGKKLMDESEFSRVVNKYSRSLLEHWKLTTLIHQLPFIEPFLRMFSPKLNETRKIIEKMENKVWEEISSHEKNQDGNPPEDLIDYYIREVSMKDVSSDFTKRNLNGNSQLLLMAGNDTTLSSMEWALLEMAQRPEMQDRAYREIVQVLGNERLPTWHDRDKLPYLDAFLAESSRVNSIAPLAVPHWTNSATKISGYDVPKDVNVYYSIHAVHSDPKLWRNPQVFSPDRFLTPDGKRIKDPDFLIPFGIGKRACPGDKLAREEVFVFVSSILQHFEILPPSGGVSMEVAPAVVMHPKYPFVRVRPRV